MVDWRKLGGWEPAAPVVADVPYAPFAPLVTGPTPFQRALLQKKLRKTIIPERREFAKILGKVEAGRAVPTSIVMKRGHKGVGLRTGKMAFKSCDAFGETEMAICAAKGQVPFCNYRGELRCRPAPAKVEAVKKAVVQVEKAQIEVMQSGDEAKRQKKLASLAKARAKRAQNVAAKKSAAAAAAKAETKAAKATQKKAKAQKKVTAGKKMVTTKVKAVKKDIKAKEKKMKGPGKAKASKGGAKRGDTKTLKSGKVSIYGPYTVKKSGEKKTGWHLKKGQ